MKIASPSAQRSAHTQKSARCLVCDTPLGLSASLNTPPEDSAVCQNFECQRFIEQGKSLPENVFKARLVFQQSLNREKQAEQTERERNIEARIRQEEAENQRLLQSALAGRCPSLEGEAYMMVIPAGRTQIAPLNAARLAAYRAHLEKIVAQAQSPDAGLLEARDQNLVPAREIQLREAQQREAPELEAIGDHLCSLCKGACCSSGQDHAYLSPLSIRRAMDANPDLDGQGIVSLYLACLPEESIENACINQTSTGCSLPKALRSDICNAYFCDPILKYYRAAKDSPEMKQVFAIQREYIHAATMHKDVDNPVMAKAFVSVDGVELVE
ncbi:hypothetical protein M0G74_01525 [Microbulbifer sp. CAU 1566]|uniref:hypothetical protein n=1 Tax=Microbulbifer sp. CAU 1566 TaxID=2933269 RepID=UPI002003CDC4|nr:hypothetical protein [Microbulbifer sp. CAU 1566]MCK7595945.1 hypothetical protein [Microbulbifer sp. CAU 1566]